MIWASVMSPNWPKYSRKSSAAEMPSISNLHIRHRAKYAVQNRTTRCLLIYFTFCSFRCKAAHKQLPQFRLLALRQRALCINLHRQPWCRPQHCGQQGPEQRCLKLVLCLLSQHNLHRQPWCRPQHCGQQGPEQRCLKKACALSSNSTVHTCLPSRVCVSWQICAAASSSVSVKKPKPLGLLVYLSLHATMDQAGSFAKALVLNILAH